MDTYSVMHPGRLPLNGGAQMIFIAAILEVFIFCRVVFFQLGTDNTLEIFDSIHLFIKSFQIAAVRCIHLIKRVANL